jgi:hypothetical protein
MALSLEERRRIARENGAKSKGGLTAESRRNSSRNRIEDGLFARTHLVDEDPAAVARLRQRYLDLVRPETPDQEFLALECFQGHLMGLRYHRARADLLNRQQALNLERWEQERAFAVQKLRARLVDPDTVDILPIINALKGFGHGLSYLTEEWLRLRRALTERGYLWPEAVNVGLRLLGVRPSCETLAQHEDGFLFALWCFAIHPVPPPTAFASMLQPENRPPGLRDVPAAELLPDPATCREELIQWIDDELTDLQAAEERVWIEVDGPARARVLNPGALVMDPEQSQRYDRAARLYQSIFYKARSALEAGRSREAAARPRPQPSAAPAEAEAADIKPPAPRCAGVSEPFGTPDAVTEVVAPEEVEASGQGQKEERQNDPRIGPDGAVGDRPEARRSYHKTVAKRAVATIVRDRSRAFDQRRPGPRRE